MILLLRSLSFVSSLSVSAVLVVLLCVLHRFSLSVLSLQFCLVWFHHGPELELFGFGEGLGPLLSFLWAFNPSCCC